MIRFALAASLSCKCQLTLECCPGQALHVVQGLEQQCEAEFVDEKRRQLLLHTLNSAACHKKLKELGEAIGLCDKVLALESGNVKALYIRAACSRLRGDFDDAHRDLKRLLVRA